MLDALTVQVLNWRRNTIHALSFASWFMILVCLWYTSRLMEIDGTDADKDNGIENTAIQLQLLETFYAGSNSETYLSHCAHPPSAMDQVLAFFIENMLFYAEEKCPKQNKIEEYASALDLTYKQVCNWFTERRRKERRVFGASNSFVKSFLNEGIFQASKANANYFNKI